MKQCRNCKEWKDRETDFYRKKDRKDGFDDQCKECVKSRQHQYYHQGEGKKKARAYRATEEGRVSWEKATLKYEKSEKGKEARRSYRRSHPDQRLRQRTATPHKKEYDKEYQKTQARKTYRKGYGRRLWNERREQRQANNAVNAAVRYGRMPHVSILTCQECGNQADHYHHHKGYAKEYWLDVVPVCVKCHRLLETK